MLPSGWEEPDTENEIYVCWRPPMSGSLFTHHYNINININIAVKH